MGALTQITDEGFPGFKCVDFVDGYIVGVEPFGRYWFHSDLADALSYNTLDRYEAESQPDRIVGLVVVHREVFVLGERTGEFFRNTGEATGTFQRIDGTELEVGCAATETMRKMDNSVFWLGNDGCVYRLNGYQPVRISTHALEQAISRCNMSEAFAFTYEDRGHKIYYLTFPDGKTWGFDVSTNEWARRQSFGLDRWRFDCMVRWNNQWIAGDYVNGKLYRLDWDQPWENGEVIEKRRVTGVLHGNQNRVTLDAVELVFDTGPDDVGPGELFPAQPQGPSIEGAAPDGVVGSPYAGYTYTTTAGDAPIVRTKIIGGALPDGLEWDETTATINTDDPTLAGTYTVTLKVEDANGLWATLTDTIVVIAQEILPPQLSDWRYMQFAADHATDYSDPDFDDSAWLTGTAPFGSWEASYDGDDMTAGAPDELLGAHAYDSRFASSFATEWETNTRLWLRRTFTLASVPPSGLNVTSFMDDNYLFYVNGVLLVTSDSGLTGGGGASFPISSDALVVGENVIAIRCDDEAPVPSASVVYADFIIEWLP